MLREDAPDYILIDIDAKRMGDLLRDPRTAETPLRRFISTIAAMSSFDGPFGPGRRRCGDEKSSRYFCLINA